MNRVHSTAKTQLRIGHVPGSSPAAFQVVRLGDGKSCAPASPLPPSGFPVEGRPDSDLLNELQWYLETFLDYPFPPQTDHAERVLNSLRAWGQQAFMALFDNRIAGAFFDAATAEDYSALYLEIASDDSQVLAWPWEALCDPRAGWLAHTCQIERRLNTPYDPQRLPSDLPQDRVNILLVIARPYGNRDVGFRSVGRPLVDLIEHDHLPAHVDLLRPPTFDRLRQHLREHPGYYHILHFDGHGAYAASTQQAGGYTMQAAEGMLVFEKENGQPDPISSEKLGTLLKECALPGVVLNACQSGMVDAKGKDPFASVATTLLRSGMRDVVAMAYSLYVSGAQQFLPSFYGRLFEVGDMAAAVRAGRQQMWRNDARHSPRGDFPLQDWLLPVLYRQDPISFSFASEKGAAKKEAPSQLPEDLQRDKDPYGFVGRDSAILEMERAMRRPPAAILVQGLGGTGKTTLARGFLRWLEATGGLGNGSFWLGFQQIRSAEYVFNRLGEAVFGGTFPRLPMEEKVTKLIEVFREHRFVIVWDNFESARGIAGTAISANLPEGDLRLLAEFLDGLRGGASKVIVTSRSTEDWLGSHRRFLLPLGGLDREERWEYCTVILRDLGLNIDRNDKDLVGLMNLLGGHPLSMRIILPKLERSTAAQVAASLDSNLAGMTNGDDEAQAKLNSTLQFVKEGLPPKLQPLLIPLGMHEGYVDADYLEAMAKGVDESWARSSIDELMQDLVSAGLLRDLGQAIYELHPLLTSYLRSISQAGTSDDWPRQFVSVTASIADELTPLKLYRQQPGFQVYGQTFHQALAHAERLEMLHEAAALTQSLAFFAINTRSFTDAFRLFANLAQHNARRGDLQGEAGAYHQMGRVAEEQRDFDGAEMWYRKSLERSEKMGYASVAACTYHHLGSLAAEQRDFVSAEKWHLKSIETEEKLGNEAGVATSYHQLGIVAHDERKFSLAEERYKKSLEIKQKLGDEHGTAITYHQLGRVAEDVGRLDDAETMYRKSLAIKERFGDETSASTTYHALGMIANAQQEYAIAEGWYQRSLAISERLGNEHVAAKTYHELGRVAQNQQDFGAASQWLRKAVAIKERLNDRHGAARTYGQLGIVAALSGDISECGRCFVKSITNFMRTNDEDSAMKNIEFLLTTWSNVSPEERQQLEAIWIEAGLGDFPKEGEG